mmetsp:Transcript_14230/g.30320  ORF Transcript_14230/g.30320 Transcript_14230/m.30320 type:complete len:460 (-) Transcript_14230:435-1814(-)|eukprot:CAMPEP_0183704056 /NCGR_PEP_ID=MMETSP0737-20130205/1534_1 /TAXON_ID=385413 /ORGANISM="Thalassiosira miniscula, Strain CCMP1093" /LENGTH=459 /DNA_ID=CAMNT_0025930867 /DNA_START=277 /DNA_END=1656 /DNA_ORIENTATION=-
MQLRTRTTIATSLALLSSAAYSSPPLAFTTTNNNGRSSKAFSTRVRKRVLARNLLRAMPTDQSSAEFARPRRSSKMSPTANSKTGGGMSTSTTSSSSSTSTTLSMIVDAQKEFEINLGRAVDTLKKDYPSLLTKNPSWEIYHSDLEVIDPTGVSLHGLDNYKMAFGFIHGVVKWFYCEEKSGLTSIRVGYDWARKCIRVSWNVELVPRMIYGGSRNILHVDGISEYYLDRESGLITEHKVSHLLINDQPVRPENGVFNALAEISPVDPEGVPVFFGADGKLSWEDISKVNFQTWNPLQRTPTSLFSNPNESAMQLPDNANSINTDAPLPYDRDALQRKNASRKKFGMPPLTPEEFIAIEEEVRAMDAMNKKKAAYLAEQIAQQKANQKKEDGFLSNIFGGALKNGCESNFDCERPQVCCDVGFKKICCSNGLGIVDGIPVEKYERGLLRVPLPNDNIDY